MSSAATRFVGSIPELYDRHMGPVLFEPYAQELAQRLPRGARRVLEVAAGTGRVTRRLLEVLPADATLIATDLNEPMLAEAQQRLGPDPRLTWQTADMQALPFEDARFDAVVCQFGLMFAPDKSLALREMRRVLRSGGTLLLTTWNALDKNGATALLQDLAIETFPEDPPTFFMKTPFCLPDPDELRAMAHDAGFPAVRVQTIDKIAESESAAHLATGLVRGNPLWNQLVERGLDAASFEAKVAVELARVYGDAPNRSPVSAHILTAVA